ncbi:SDR family NAD(P)-dependent oxidoreductase [Oceanicella sp. SM1341]|uniref:SDR family NAD(P)-dependent oxidoreductase n=1 Tax=Oceanicella sp. SM1341 TaxID=1548889 RepID=UPI000E4C4EEB|nr:SDR family NAD(P)-dependent oxidoreductase [Oceanicella sp. SM1341]
MSAPALPPRLRSAPALGLTARAAEGRFALQHCAECGAVQYPPQEICAACLSGDLRWKDVAPKGHLLAGTRLSHSLEPFFQARAGRPAPWRLGLVRHESGAVLTCFVHAACAGAGPVRLSLTTDRAGMACLLALPEHAEEEDPMLAQISAVTGRGPALVTDATTPVGAAFARALLARGAGPVWLGHAGPLDPALAGAEGARPLDISALADVAEVTGPLALVVSVPGPGTGTLEEEMAATCFAPARLAAALSPVLAGAAWLAVLGIEARVPDPARPAPSAALAAAEAWLIGLRETLSASGGRAIGVYPGPLALPGTEEEAGPRLALPALARAALAALESGVQELFPDPVSRHLLARAATEGKAVGRGA